ncbi:MAG TPA: VOC family protein [Nitrososphaerales archaeon]|nr:VOC family protein [Nitrososphaerales archaeon]
MKSQILDESNDSEGSSAFHMNPEMKLGAPTLRVRDLARELAFYQAEFGLHILRSYKDMGLEVVELGFENQKDPLLKLRHDPSAKSPAHDFAGLYHYAVLVPDRKSLACTYLAVGNSGAPYDGFADHTVSESLYLPDAEANGIEIYADRPRETWAKFKDAMNSENRENFSRLNRPLDFNSLLKELSSEERKNPSPFPSGARIGHMHLRVTNLERSVHFYNEKLGLDIIGNLSEIGAAFLSTGGYHHHVGLNTWHSLDGTPRQDNDVGLDEFKIIVPEKTIAELEREFPNSRSGDRKLSIRDPDGIRIFIEAA